MKRVLAACSAIQNTCSPTEISATQIACFPPRHQQPKSLAARALTHVDEIEKQKADGRKSVWLRQGRDVLEPRNATVITGRLMQEHWLCPPPAERREGMGLGKGQSRTVADRPGAPPRCPPSNIRVAELARPSAPPASRSLGPRGRRSSPPRCHEAEAVSHLHPATFSFFRYFGCLAYAVRMTSQEA